MVNEVLSTWIATQGSPRSMLTAAIGDVRFATALPEGAPVLLIAKTVDLCVQDAWNNTPPWLEKLFMGLNLLQIDPSISVLWQAVSQRKPPPTADTLARTILNGSTPFVNRTDFRIRLNTLASEAARAQPILVIDGAARSGKSYSTRYIDHFVNTKAGITHYLYPPFDPEQATATGPEEIATDLVRMMGRPLKEQPQPNTNKDRYCVELVQWVFNEATQLGGQHWFVFDNFRSESLRPDTRKFLTTLTSLVVTGRYPVSCRLILIGIDQTLLGVDSGKVENEEISPCKPADIDAVLSELNALLPAIGVATLRTFVANSLPLGAAKMPELDRRLRLLLLALKRLSPLLANASADLDHEAILLEMLRDLPSDNTATPELRNRLTALADSLQTL